MRSFTSVLAAVLLLGPAGAARADEEAEEIASQKKAAAANWETVEAGEVASHETKHFLVYAPKATEKRLKGSGVLLEKYHDVAAKALALDPKEALWPGKLTVYLFGERGHFTAFVRRVEKRRLVPDETASWSAKGRIPHVAASPGRGKGGLGVEAQAGEQIAEILLAHKAGVRTALPEWLTAGFGRATHYRVAPTDKAVIDDRRKAGRLARTRNPKDVWNGTVNADEAGALWGSLADFMAYGPGAKKFPAFVVGFKPEENMLAKTTDQALKAASLSADRIAASWKKWALNPR